MKLWLSQLRLLFPEAKAVEVYAPRPQDGVNASTSTRRSVR